VIDGYLLATVPLADDVPFFTAVYSGHLIYHGIRMMPGNTDEAFFAAHARQLLWGVTPGWIFSWLMEYPHLASKAKIVVRMANLRHAAKNYLAYGSLTGDLKSVGPLETVAFDFNDYDSEAVDAKPKSTTRAELPAVIGTVWTSADGKGRAVVAIPGAKAPTAEISDGRLRLTLAPQTMGFLVE